MEFDDITGASPREQALLMKTMEQENELQELRKLVGKIPKRPATAPSSGGRAAASSRSDATSLNANFVNTQKFSILPEAPAHNTPQPPPVESHTLVGARGGKLLLFGGTNGSNLSNELWVFTLTSSAAGRRGWRRRKCDGNVPPPRCGHSAVMHNHHMFIFGGYGSTLSSPTPILLNSVYFLDTETFEWTAVVTSPMEAVKNHTTELYKGRVYLFGGCTVVGRSNRIHVFDLETLKWFPNESFNTQLGLTNATDVPTARSGHSSVLHGSSMVIFGGRMTKTLYCNDAYRYSFDTKLWSRVYCGGQIPAPRASHSASVYKNNMILFGGYACQGSQVLGPLAMSQAEPCPSSGKKIYYDDCHVLNLASYTWYSIILEGPLRPLGRCGHAATLYEGPHAALHMLTYGGWGVCARNVVDMDEDEDGDAVAAGDTGAVATNAETWNFVCGVVDTTTPRPKNVKPSPVPPVNIRAATSHHNRRHNLKEPGSTPRPWSVMTSKATTAKYFGSVPLASPLTLTKCSRTPREIETIVQRLGDTTRHELVMKQLEGRYLAHFPTNSEEDARMTMAEQTKSVDRMYYQQVEWREEKMRQLRTKWVPEKPAKHMTESEIEETMARLCSVPEPMTTWWLKPPEAPATLTKEEEQEAINRMFYQAIEGAKNRHLALDKKYRAEVPPLKVGAEQLDAIIKRLQTPYGKGKS